MRIRLRPYHVTGILAFIGSGPRTGHFNDANAIADLIQRNPGAEIEVTTQYDDICATCQRRIADPKGSVWGPGQSCESARNPEIVAQVADENSRILAALGVKSGAILPAAEWLLLVAERIPDISNLPNSGGAAEQQNYRQGIQTLRQTWRIPEQR